MNGAFEPGEFTWVLGIEDTCVYPVDEDAAALDEHELTGHNAQWQADLTRVRDLGATAVRYGVSWPLVHVAPDRFDWTVLDELIPFAVDELGLAVIADLVHYGTPRWLADSFADADYPEAIESFSREFATRYAGRVTHFTPLNEPVTTASFCGLRGIWPPALEGWEGWVAVAVPMAIGMVKSMAAIREANPAATIVHVEAATRVDTTDVALESHVELLRGIGWLPTDLMLGRVEPRHPLYGWLVEHGADPLQLEWLLAHGAAPDVLGVNYYPDLTPRHIARVEGTVAQVSYNDWSRGLRLSLLEFAERYSLPLAVTETSIEGDDALRTAWLEDSVQEVASLVASGLDIRGYTWWPLLDFVDWSWAAGGANVEEFVVERPTGAGETTVGPPNPRGDPSAGVGAFLRRMGLVRVDERTDGSLSRTSTQAATAYLALTVENLRPVNPPT